MENSWGSGTKLVATYDTPIHEDLSLIYYLFHTLGTCQKLAGEREGRDFQLSAENKMTLPR